MITEKDFSDNELSEISKLYEQIVKQHDLCGGSGLSLVSGKEVSDCQCEAVFKYMKELIFSNLPKGYYGAQTEDLSNYFDNAKELKKFKDALFCDSGILVGLPGEGKTALLATIGKLAILERRFVVYITPENLLRIVRNEDILVDRIYASEIVLFDSLEKYHRSAWADGQLEFILRNLSDKGKVIYITVSDSIKELEGSISSGLLDFIKCQIHNKFLIGYKKKKSSLKTDNYFEKGFVKEATENFTEVLEMVSA